MICLRVCVSRYTHVFSSAYKVSNLLSFSPFWTYFAKPTTTLTLALDLKKSLETLNEFPSRFSALLMEKVMSPLSPMIISGAALGQRVRACLPVRWSGGRVFQLDCGRRQEGCKQNGKGIGGKQTYVGKGFITLFLLQGNGKIIKRNPLRYFRVFLMFFPSTCLLRLLTQEGCRRKHSKKTRTYPRTFHYMTSTYPEETMS